MRIGICGVNAEEKKNFLELLKERWPGLQPMPFVLDPFKHGAHTFFPHSVAYSAKQARVHYVRAHKRYSHFLTTATLYDLYAGERFRGYLGGDEAVWWAKCLSRHNYDQLFYVRPIMQFDMDLDAELAHILQFFRVPSNVLEGTMEDKLEQFSFVMGVRLREAPSEPEEGSDELPE